MKRIFCLNRQTVTHLLHKENFKGWNISSLRIGKIIIFITDGSISFLEVQCSTY